MLMSNLINRRGKFSINRDLLRDSNNENLLKLFAHMIIVRAEYMFVKDTVEYEAMSPLFREIEIHESAPQYEIICIDVYSDDLIIDMLFKTKEIKKS